jgi:hypothetical protein
MFTYFRITQPVPVGGAIQNSWILVLLRGVLSVTMSRQLLMNYISSSSMIYGKYTHENATSSWEGSYVSKLTLS